MADSLARLSSMIESARDLTIEAAVSARSRLVDTPTALRPKEISRLLNSRIERENINGMKYVISLISRGEDGLEYFADVVKNITSPNLKVKILVLIYVSKYAESDPNTALLSINSIQKLLGDKQPYIRSSAIKTMAGIRIPSILPILQICIKKSVTDRSPLVRASTAIAIGKVFDMHSPKKELITVLWKLLSDSDPQVVSASLKVYYKLKDQLSQKKQWEPIHGNFRRLCNIVEYLDEWSQTVLIEILTEYSRFFLPKPKLAPSEGSQEIIDLPNNYKDIPYSLYEVRLDKDLELFLNALRPLVYSSSETVILAIAKALIFLSPPLMYTEFKINQALINLINYSSNNQILYFSLHIIKLMAALDSVSFSKFYKKFYLFPNDDKSIIRLKLDILSLIWSDQNAPEIWEELKYYALSSNNFDMSSEAVVTIGKFTTLSHAWTETVMKWCLINIRNAGGITQKEIFNIIKFIIQKKSKQSTKEEEESIRKTIHTLYLFLTDPEMDFESDAKAGIIWIIGEYTHIVDNLVARAVLRKLIRNFAFEKEKTRYALLVLSVKSLTYEITKYNNEHEHDDELLMNHLKENDVYKFYKHILHLANYDPSYDIRDRARLFHVLLNTGSKQFELASLFIQAPKLLPDLDPTFKKFDRSVGSMNIILLTFLTVPEWSDESLIPPDTVRKPVPVLSNSIGGNMASLSSASVSKIPQFKSEANIRSQDNTGTRSSYKLQSLDEFFGTSEQEESSSDASSESEQSESESSEEESEHDSEHDSEHASDTSDDLLSD